MSSNHSIGHRRAATTAGVLAVALVCLLLLPNPLAQPLDAVVDLSSFWAACVGLLPAAGSGFLTGAVAAAVSIGISHWRRRHVPQRRTSAMVLAGAAE